MAKHSSTSPARKSSGNASAGKARKPKAAAAAPASSAREPVPLEVYLRYQPWKQRGFVMLLLLVIAGLSWADHSGWFLYAGDDWHRYHDQSFRVVRVLDGDTLVIDMPDADKALTRVRLWGIDTPEVARHDGDRLVKEAEPFADAARDAVVALADGQVVRLELQSHRIRERFGRLLAYVELPDGSSLNERLIVAGLARNDPRFLHRDSQRYEMLESQARTDRAGMWAK